MTMLIQTPTDSIDSFSYRKSEMIFKKIMQHLRKIINTVHEVCILRFDRVENYIQYENEEFFNFNKCAD